MTQVVVLDDLVNQTGTVATIGVVMPATVNNKDTLLVGVSGSFPNGAAVSAPGFTLLAEGVAVAVFGKVADGTEDGTTVTFTATSGVIQNAKVMRLDNAHETIGSLCSGDVDATLGGSAASASLNLTGVPDEALLIYWDWRNTALTTVSASNGFTVQNGGVSQRCATATKAQSGAGSSGATIVTASTTVNHWDLLMAIVAQPAAVINTVKVKNPDNSLVTPSDYRVKMPDGTIVTPSKLLVKKPDATIQQVWP